MGIKWCERPNEGPVQSQVDFLWRCPEQGPDAIGWGDPSLVHCSPGKVKCRTIAAVTDNHDLSQKMLSILDPIYLPQRSRTMIQH